MKKLVAVAALLMIVGCTKKQSIEIIPEEPIVHEESIIEEPEIVEIVPMKSPAYEKLYSLKNIYFDTDSWIMAGSQLEVLANNFSKLDSVKNILLIGHADERHTDEYNMELGMNRAKSVKDGLYQLGFDESKISIESVGEQSPVCYEHNESCWQKNRRVEFWVELEE